MEPNYKVVYVSTEEQLLQAVAEISKSNCIAFDCEGVDLGRDGPLTVATFSTLASEAPIYVVDVQGLGGDKVFASSAFKGILASKGQRKIMFDCRADSDALFHQFGVRQRTGWDSLIHFIFVLLRKFHRRRTCVKFSQLSCTNHYIITIYSGQRSLAHYFENGTKL